jgi:hypothetical protein
MSEEDLDEHDLKKLPEDHDNWSDEEPGLPEWEEYLEVDEKTSSDGDGDIDKLIISLSMFEDAYVSSTLSVNLDDWL